MHKAVEEKKKRQAEVLRNIRSGDSATTATLKAGLSSDRFWIWKASDPEFREAADEALAQRVQVKRIGRQKDAPVFDPDTVISQRLPLLEARDRFVGRPTPWHMRLLADAWEDKTNNIVIYLGPTGGGKDTTAGDIVLGESCDRNTKVAWVMESANFSERRLGRLEPYFWDPSAYRQPEGPDTWQPPDRLWEVFGRFRWETGLIYPNGDKVGKPKWTQSELYFVGRDNESDPNIWATGIGGATYGSRINIGVLSDIFTQENQQSPTLRASQMDWITGTFMTRLDDQGRALFIGTRVGAWDNWPTLIDVLKGSARVIREDQFQTKYSNGLCVITVPAVLHRDGAEVCYWPERFSLDSYYRKDDEIRPAREVDDVEVIGLAEEGWTYVKGLREVVPNRRQFEAMMNQNPEAGSGGEFPPPLLDKCDDYQSSYGHYKPGSMLVLGIDPARAGGAAWVLWSVQDDRIRVVDWFYGDNLGVSGIRDRLLIDPITTYAPRWVVYEDNREASILEHPLVMDTARQFGSTIKPHNTNSMNRGVGELKVAAMSVDMASDLIKWPAATVDDRRRSDMLKEHFLNWDQREAQRLISSQKRLHIPDDLAMAAWVGWVRVKELTTHRHQGPQARRMPASVQRSWGWSNPLPAPKGNPASDPLDMYHRAVGSDG